MNNVNDTKHYLKIVYYCTYIILITDSLATTRHGETQEISP